MNQTEKRLLAAERAAKAAARKAAPPKPEKTYHRQCQACGEMHGTHKARAVRCQPCIAASRRVTIRSCAGCDAQFPTYGKDEAFCPTCRGDENLLLRSEEEIMRERNEAQKARWRERIHSPLMSKLAAREKAPKGYRKMSKKTTKLPIGVLWLSMCHADGAAHSVTHAATTDLSEEDKLALLISFFRLRSQGYHPSQLAMLCPVALLEAETQDAISDLPKVEEADPELTWSEEQDLEAEAILLGLHTTNQPREGMYL